MLYTCNVILQAWWRRRERRHRRCWRLPWLCQRRGRWRCGRLWALRRERRQRHHHRQRRRVSWQRLGWGASTQQHAFAQLVCGCLDSRRRCVCTMSQFEQQQQLTPTAGPGTGLCPTSTHPTARRRQMAPFPTAPSPQRTATTRLGGSRARLSGCRAGECVGPCGVQVALQALDQCCDACAAKDCSNQGHVLLHAAPRQGCGRLSCCLVCCYSLTQPHGDTG